MLERIFVGLYMPHGYCLLWEPWLVSLHAVSDVLTFLAYAAIPLAIWMFVRRRPHLELRGLALLFAAFILWCGLTHLFGVITLWYPLYELQGGVKAVTAAISVTTAGMIFPLIPKALAIPSPSELQVANRHLQQEVDAHRRTLEELREARAELETRVADRTRELQDATDRFRSLFDHAPVALVMVSDKGTVLHVNTAAEEAFRSDGERLAAATAETLIPAFTVSSLSGQRVEVGTKIVLDGAVHRPDGSTFPAEIGISRLPGGGGEAIIVSLADLSLRKKEEERLQIIMRELSHRSKNLLAVVQGMARQIAKSSPDKDAFLRDFSARLHSLARSHDLLVGRSWEGVGLMELVDAQVGPQRQGDSVFSISGPDVFLLPEAAQPLGMALHELWTNAVKHGAIANAGTIDIAWRIHDERMLFTWQETCPRLITPTQRRGFGRVVLEQVVPDSVRGAATLSVTSDGMQWTLEVALATLTLREASIETAA